jgi:hypothetical protein
MNNRYAGTSSWKIGFAAVAAGTLVAVLGCGDANRASVTGKVTANGEPVTGGTLSFAPIGGGAKPAMTAVGADGTYNLSDDGVPIGKNSVTYMAPPAQYPEGMEPKPGDLPTPSAWEGYKVATNEIEIKSGAQTIDIELTK